MQPRPRKRAKVCAADDSQHVALFVPTALLRHIAAFVRDAQALASFALASKRTLAAVTQLPDTACLMLRGGEVFRDCPFPIGRALRVLLYRKCELCGRGNVKGAKPAPFRLFAHDACISAQLKSARFMPPALLARLQAANAPFLEKQLWDGMQPYFIKLYWKAAHPLVHACETIDGVKDLSLEDAAAAGEARLAREAAAKAQLDAPAPRIAQLRALHELTAETKRVRCRRRRLDKALLAAGLQSVAQLEAAYGLPVIFECIGKYLQADIRAFSQDKAVQRLQYVVEAMPTLAERAAEGVMVVL